MYIHVYSSYYTHAHFCTHITLYVYMCMPAWLHHIYIHVHVHVLQQGRILLTLVMCFLYMYIHTLPTVEEANRQKYLAHARRPRYGYATVPFSVGQPTSEHSSWQQTWANVPLTTQASQYNRSTYQQPHPIQTSSMLILQCTTCTYMIVHDLLCVHMHSHNVLCIDGMHLNSYGVCGQVRKGKRVHALFLLCTMHTIMPQYRVMHILVVT